MISSHSLPNQLLLNLFDTFMKQKSYLYYPVFPFQVILVQCVCYICTPIGTGLHHPTAACPGLPEG